MSASRESVLMVGCGKMGSALARGWLAKKSARVTVIDPVAPASDLRSSGSEGASSPPTKDKDSVAWFPSLDSVPADFKPAVVVIALKPQMLEAALPAYGKRFPSSAFLSIAAGQRLENLERFLGPSPVAVVRAMPNLPASVGQGMTVAVANPRITAAQRTFCAALLQTTGDFVWLDSESLLDSVTALSGSGPAYVFALIETMAVAGVRLGLPLDLATRLARQTVIGSGVLLQREGGQSASELRQAVTSPGGTTEAALQVLLADDGLPGLMLRALRAASERAKELRGNGPFAVSS